MTVIVWDGAFLAADCMGSVGDLKVVRKKINRRSDGTLWASSGMYSLAAAMAKAIFDGAEWPKAASDEDADLIVVSPSREVVYYTHHRPEPVEVLQCWMAWGSGREFAIGALAMGARADAAVKVAIDHCHGCGYGIQMEWPGIGGDGLREDYTGLPDSDASLAGWMRK